LKGDLQKRFGIKPSECKIIHFDESLSDDTKQISMCNQPFREYVGVHCKFPEHVLKTFNFEEFQGVKGQDLGFKKPLN